jgi:hypothetical protein
MRYFTVFSKKKWQMYFQKTEKFSEVTVFNRLLRNEGLNYKSEAFLKITRFFETFTMELRLL